MRRAVLGAVVVAGLVLLARPAPALIDVLRLDHTEEQTEFVLLKVPFVSVLEVEVEKEGRSHTTFVDVPFITVFELEQSEERSAVDVLDVPLIGFFSYEREGNEKSKTHFLKLPIIGSFYGHERDGNNWRMQFLYFIRTSSE